MIEIERVWNRLIEHKENLEIPDEDRCTITPEDERYLREDIDRKLDDGWTEDEVFHHFKWMEYFDDYVHTEHRCLDELSRTEKESYDRRRRAK